MIGKLRSALNPVGAMLLSGDIYDEVYNRFKRECAKQTLSAESREVVENLTGLIDLLHSDTIAERFNIDRDRGVCRAFWDWKSPPSIQALTDAEVNELYSAINKMAMQREIATLSYSRKQKFMMFLCIRLDDILELFDISWESGGASVIPFSKVEKATKKLADKAKTLRKQDKKLAELLAVLAYLPYGVYRGNSNLSATGDKFVETVDIANYPLQVTFSNMFGGVPNLNAITGCLIDPMGSFNNLFGNNASFGQYCDELTELIEASKLGVAPTASSDGGFANVVKGAVNIVTDRRRKRDAYFENMGFDMSGGQTERVIQYAPVATQAAVTRQPAQRATVTDARQQVRPQVSGNPATVQSSDVASAGNLVTLLNHAVSVSANGIHTTFSIPALDVYDRDFVMFTYYEDCIGPELKKECFEFNTQLKKLLKKEQFDITFCIQAGRGILWTADLGEFMQMNGNGKFGNKYAQNLYRCGEADFEAERRAYEQEEAGSEFLENPYSGAKVIQPVTSSGNSRVDEFDLPEIQIEKRFTEEKSRVRTIVSDPYDIDNLEEIRI